MIVNGKIKEKVEINPLEVIKNLYKGGEYNNEKEYFEKDGKYYQRFIIKGVDYSNHTPKEITKRDYDYYLALEIIIDYLMDFNIK